MIHRVGVGALGMAKCLFKAWKGYRMLSNIVRSVLCFSLKKKADKLQPLRMLIAIKRLPIFILPKR